MIYLDVKPSAQLRCYLLAAHAAAAAAVWLVAANGLAAAVLSVLIGASLIRELRRQHAAYRLTLAPDGAATLQPQTGDGRQRRSKMLLNSHYSGFGLLLLNFTAAARARHCVIFADALPRTQRRRLRRLLNGASAASSDPVQQARKRV